MPDRNLTPTGYKYFQYWPKLFFECRACKSRSPVIEIDKNCIDISEVKKIMNDSIIELNEMEVSDND